MFRRPVVAEGRKYTIWGPYAVCHCGVTRERGFVIFPHPARAVMAGSDAVDCGDGGSEALVGIYLRPGDKSQRENVAYT